METKGNTMNTGTVSITVNTKGAGRIWIESLESKGIQAGGYFKVAIAPEKITVDFVQASEKPKGYRKNGSKGGILDIQSKACADWAQGATSAQWEVVSSNQLVIKRAQQ